MSSQFNFIITALFSETVPFALYICICLMVTKSRFPRRILFFAYSGMLFLSAAAMTAAILTGHEMAAFTLFPLITYLPFSIFLYFLSEYGLLEWAITCCTGALAALTVKILKKIMLGFFFRFGMKMPLIDIVIPAVMLLSASALFLTVWFIKNSFRIWAESESQNKLLVLIPILTVLLLIFGSLNSLSPFAPVLLILALIITVSLFAIISRLFTYSAKISKLNQNEKLLFDSLKRQQQNFETLSQTVEAQKHYQHDIRHHMNALTAMAKQDNAEQVLKYLSELNNTDSLAGSGIYCRNSLVNAVLSEYIGRAQKLGFEISHKIFIPEDIPFELPDICIILSNALENALAACEKCPPDERRIKLSVDFSDEKKMTVSVKNSCSDIVKLDAERLPVIKKSSDGHGIGLRGVKKVVEKYNGFLCCDCKDNEFIFHAVVFCSPPCEPDRNGRTDGKSARPNHSKALLVIPVLLVYIIVFLNILPRIKTIIPDVQSYNLKLISYDWGAVSFYATLPEFSEENLDAFNKASEDFIDEASDIFWQHVLQKYEGYVAEDTNFQVLLDDEEYLSVRFLATLNIGGSMDFSRCVTFDKRRNAELSLADLFDENDDYIGIISAEILRQMEYRVKNEKAVYFIPGGIWRDDTCFKEISPQQNFYLNSDRKLVIVFDEYEVAPGSMGSPEFEMPDTIFSLD